MHYEECIIVGGGPCGLAAAIRLKEIGINPLIIEKENIVHSIYRFPTHQTFFSSSDRLEIGGVPFITENRKPTRNQALAYYREVVKIKQLRIAPFEAVESVGKTGDLFTVTTSKDRYEAKFIIIATGYYDHPNDMNIPGEELPKVFHYFKEAHPYFGQNVVVIGGKNSSVDAALALQQAGAKVTVLYRGSEYSNHIKPWVLPEFEAMVRNGKIAMVFQANVIEITPNSVIYEVDGKREEIANDFVFAMTGYHPDHLFLTKMGVTIDPVTGWPFFNEETMETNVEGIFIAGVIAAGNNANEIFIENGRFHGDLIANEIKKRLNS